VEGQAVKPLSKLFGLAVVPRQRGHIVLTLQERQRMEHVLAMHGRSYYTEGAHRREHEANDRAIEQLRRGGTFSVWITSVIMERHDHLDGDY
jgi:hypothetical protein